MHKSPSRHTSMHALHNLKGVKMYKSKGEGSFHFVYASIRGKCNVPDVVNVNDAIDAAYLVMVGSRDHTQTHTKNK